MDKLKIIQGSTLAQPIRWYVEPYIYKPITEVVSLAPLRLKVVGHGLPPFWKTEVLSVKGMIEINSTEKEKPTDYHYATLIDDDIIEFNDVNASNYGPYVNGTGHIRYYTPASLANKVATLYIWDRVDGTLLLTLSSATGEIDIDETDFVSLINMSDTATAALTWKKGVFAFKMRDTTTDAVVEVSSGSVLVEIE